MGVTERLPVICFPHAGAGMLYYSKWKYAFNDGIDFRVVQYPLREQRMSTPMPGSVSSLAEGIFAEFIETFRGTYAIWGHSMGSVVGYEVAKLCQKLLDSPPLVFFSSGSSAPCDSRFKDVADLDAKDGLHGVLRRYGGVSEENLRDPEFMKYFSPIISADLRLLGTYEESTFEQVHCPLVLMEGRDDPISIDSWQLYTDRPMEVTKFDGGHFFLDSYRAEMASLMEARIQMLWQTTRSSVDRRGRSAAAPAKVTTCRP